MNQLRGKKSHHALMTVAGYMREHPGTSVNAACLANGVSVKTYFNAIRNLKEDYDLADVPLSEIVDRYFQKFNRVESHHDNIKAAIAKKREKITEEPEDEEEETESESEVTDLDILNTIIENISMLDAESQIRVLKTVVYFCQLDLVVEKKAQAGTPSNL